MTTEAGPIDLDCAAGDFTAGDLPADEASLFAGRMAHDPRLARDAVFWRNLRSGLAAGTAPAHAAPGQGLGRALLARHRREQEAVVVAPVTKPAGTRIPFPVSAWMATAAAACLGLAIGWWAALPHRTAGSPPDGDALAFTDDGSHVHSPDAANRIYASYLSRSAQRDVDVTRTLAAGTVDRPWIGLMTKAVELEQGGAVVNRGLLVVSVANGGPAWAAGLRPGDVVLSVDGEALVTPYCLARHLSAIRPGTTLTVRSWCGSSAQIVDQRVTVGAMSE